MKNEKLVGKFPVLTVALMNTQLMDLLNRRAQITAAVNNGLPEQSPQRQAQLLQALALCLHAAPLLEKCESGIAYLEAPAAEEKPDVSEAPLETLETSNSKDPLAEALGSVFEDLAGLAVNLVEGVCEALAEEFGVSSEAVPPFLVQTNSYMLGFIGRMFDIADAQLREDAVTNVVALPEMRTRLKAAISAYEELQEKLEAEELAEVSLERQVRNLFAVALVQLGGGLLSQAHPTALYLQEGKEGKVTIDSEVSRSIVRQYGVKAAAVVPFLLGVNSLLLPLIEELVQEAIAVFETTDSQ